MNTLKVTVVIAIDGDDTDGAQAKRIISETQNAGDNALFLGDHEFVVTSVSVA